MYALKLIKANKFYAALISGTDYLDHGCKIFKQPLCAFIPFK